MNNIRMLNIAGDAFTFDLYYANKPVAGKQDKDSKDTDAVPPVTEETPCFKNLFVSNVVCQGAARAIYFNGLPEMPLDNLVMKNSLFVCQKGAEINYAKNIVFENVTIKNAKGERMTVKNATVSEK